MKQVALTKKVQMVLSSPRLYRWIIALFIVQALLSVFFIAPSTPKDGVGGQYTERNEDGVVPDGHRHLGAIYYYAERPILSGPVIPNMTDSDLWMGDLVRFPSYLYYYVLSFPVRLAMMLGASDIVITYLVRLIGVAIGLGALLLFRRIVQMATKSSAIQNISLLALSLTGSFVWLSAAENYDIPALLLWFAFLYAGIRLFIKKELKYVYWMAIWFFLLAITKYTYIPFAGLFGLAAAGLYLKNTNSLTLAAAGKTVFSSAKVWVTGLKKWQLALGVILLVVSAGLFAERIVGNLVTYRSFNPSCARIHTHEACMKFGVYARNYNQKVRLENGTTQPIEYGPVHIGYPFYWVKRYFDSMYVYMGHIYIPMYSLLVELAGIFAVIVGIAILILARVKKIRLFKGQAEYYLFAVVIVLTLVQFIFNLNTILNYGGQTYAHQGRYLLSVVGFSYLLCLIVLSRVFAKLSARAKKITLLVGIFISAYAIVIASAIPSFLIHATHSDWYSQAAQNMLPEWLTNR